MKFIVFNIVVAVALIYLVDNKDNGVDVSLPKFGDVTAAAGQVLDRTRSEERRVGKECRSRGSPDH